MQHKTRILVLSALLASMLVNVAHAGGNMSKQTSAHGHHHAAQSKGKAQATSATRAYRDAMHHMHQAMKKPLSGNVDVDFARQMIPHHEGALVAARIQQRYGSDEQLKRFNDWIIFAQGIEIDYMKHWLRRRDNGFSPANAPDHFGDAMDAMHHAMDIPYTGDADVDYVRGMIAHHQGAVDMASTLLARGTDPELNDLANSIITSQTYEIAWMKRWLAARGLKAE